MGYSTEGVKPGDMAATLEYLERLIRARRDGGDAGSYTHSLLAAEDDRLLSKILEESGELVLAAKDGDHDHIRYELGDLVYHLMVFMQKHGIGLDELAGELDARRR